MGKILRTLWPGLDALWSEGSILGLARALGFSILLMLTALTAFIWPEWLRPWQRSVVCLCSLGYWVVMVSSDLYLAQVTREAENGARGGAEPQRIPTVAPSPGLEEILGDYLRGDFGAAQAKLTQVCSLDLEDTEALLLMATILRRVGNLREAGVYLDRAANSSRGPVWKEEIAEERLWLEAEVAEVGPDPRGEMRPRMEAA